MSSVFSREALQRAILSVEAMPLYQSHKRVRALKIKQVIKHPHPDPQHDRAKFEESSELAGVHLCFEGAAPLYVTPEWYRRHEPQAGGYYVVYEDGYASFSPAKAFEESYTLVQ